MSFGIFSFHEKNLGYTQTSRIHIVQTKRTVVFRLLWKCALSQKKSHSSFWIASQEKKSTNYDMRHHHLLCVPSFLIHLSMFRGLSLTMLTRRGRQVRVDMVRTNHDKVLTLWGHMPMQGRNTKGIGLKSRDLLSLLSSTSSPRVA